VNEERRAARERALELLYEAETKDCAPSSIIAELPIAPDPYTVTLVNGVHEHRDELDSTIAAHARGWTLERMPAVDRALLRMASYELLYEPDVPVGVAISEAVELASEFSTDDSSRFVNGVLSAISRRDG
jgi:N utilization substance protein B